MRTPRTVEFYKEQIDEMISECTHGDEFYEEDFLNKISGLWAAARLDGLPLNEFEGLIQHRLPHPLGHRLELRNSVPMPHKKVS